MYPTSAVCVVSTSAICGLNQFLDDVQLVFNFDREFSLLPYAAVVMPKNRYWMTVVMMVSTGCTIVQLPHLRMYPVLPLASTCEGKGISGDTYRRQCQCGPNQICNDRLPNHLQPRRNCFQLGANYPFRQWYMYSCCSMDVQPCPLVNSRFSSQDTETAKSQASTGERCTDSSWQTRTRQPIRGMHLYSIYIMLKCKYTLLIYDPSGCASIMYKNATASH
jgi:hypothetical protein